VQAKLQAFLISALKGDRWTAFCSVSFTSEKRAVGRRLSQVRVRSVTGDDEKSSAPTGISCSLTKSKEKLTVVQLVKTLPIFYGTQASFPCSEPDTGTYSEPVEFSPWFI
jgi:hypothetical protein